MNMCMRRCKGPEVWQPGSPNTQHRRGSAELLRNPQGVRGGYNSDDMNEVGVGGREGGVLGQEAVMTILIHLSALRVCDDSDDDDGDGDSGI